MDAAPDLDAVIARIMRADRGRLLAALIHQLGQFDLAEEALAEALVSATEHWRRSGLPDRPRAGLLQVARRKAIDMIRKTRRHQDRTPELTQLIEEDQEAADMDPETIPDERLRLIFTCCHPALEPKTRVALTLRTLGGLTTSEIARAFLDTESAMGQRLSRARAKISKAAIPYRVPEAPELPERLHSVLTVIYLIFNEGYSASGGAEPLRAGLCEEAIFLARLVCDPAPDEPEALGLLALLLLTHARRGARLDAAGGLVDLDHQDRGLWDAGMIAEGRAVLDRAVARMASGPFQIQAAISALHTEAAGPAATDWRQISFLYDELYRFEPTAVVALNRAIARAEAGGLDAALDEIAALGGELDAYQPYHAARAELLGRAGRRLEAAEAYARAIDLSPSGPERAYLRARAERQAASS